jgi:S1-C subfamily serine protease
MFCTNCGNKIKDGAKFCTSCGKSMVDKGSDIPKRESENFVPTSAPSASSPVKQKQKKLWAGGVIGAVIIIIIVLVSISNRSSSPTPQQVSSANDNTRSVVDVLCDNGQGGSGTIFSTDGTVLTNNHVIAGSTSCKVTIPNPLTGGIAEIYEAAPVIVPVLSKKYDVATLKIDASYTDTDGKSWGAYPTTFQAFTIPNTCSTSTPSKLGDSVRIYGYPVTSGGYNLTITDGIISSFADDGSILTSAQVDSGNSGGLAVDQNGCWLGIPSAVVSGNYQNLGVIIPGSVVAETFVNNVSTKLDPAVNTNAASESAVTPQETSAQICQDSFGTYSEWTGQINSKGNPTCACQTGYSWGATGNSCTLQTSLQQECQSTYGSGGYSYTQGGKAVCGCSAGYQFNNDDTACVVVQTSNSSNGSCSNGLVFDKTTGTCETPLTYCQNQNGPAAVYNSADNSCGCKEGYSLNANNDCSIPMGALCSDINAVMDKASFMTGTPGGFINCVCKTGYTPSSDGKSCVMY